MNSLFFWKKKRNFWLVVGIGNPGSLYQGNRHNVGFMCINEIARRNGISLNKKQSQARTGEGAIGGVNVLLARPQTFVNLTGKAVGPLVRKYHVTPDRLIVIHDDLDLPPGKIRIRVGGSTAGHKGVRSTVDAIGHPQFVRVKVGIGRPEATDDNQPDVIDYVLGDFTEEEKKVFETTIPQVSEAIGCILSEGVKAAMDRFN